MQASEVTELLFSERGGWMTCPKTETHHPGLAYFCPLDQLIVAVKQDPLHDLIGNTDVNYTIFNTEGQKVFLAVQRNKWRKYNIHVFNLYGNEVIQLEKRYKLCQKKAGIWSPPGQFLGSVEELSRLSCVRKFVVKNALQKAVLIIRRRKDPFQYDYDIFSDGEKVGLLTNRWRLKDILNVKCFGISFPIFMSVEYKVMMLSACFFISCG